MFQRRIDGTENFYRNWLAYKTGFGKLNGNFWLGLEKIHRITAKDSRPTLRVEVRHKNEKNGYAEYTTFRVSDESDKYRLTVGGYSGNAGDSLAAHNGMFFSTYDRDNDRLASNFVKTYRGAWWHNQCNYSNLNGNYPPASGSTDPKFISWYHLASAYGDIVFSEIKIR